MNLLANHKLLQNQYWHDVEDFFNNLPPSLFNQGVLLKNNLATFYSDTGQFRDILTREDDPPFLVCHLWLLDDRQFLESAGRTQLEKHLFLAALFNFAAAYGQDLILDDGSNVDNHYLFLVQRLRRQADAHLAHLFSGSSPFWSHHQTVWNGYDEASLAALQPLREGVALPAAEVLAQLPRRLAYSKLPIIGAAIGAGLEAQIPSLDRLLDHLNCVWQIVRDISTLRHDLARQRASYPILETIRAAGLDPNQPLVPEQVLGALTLSGVMTEIGQTCAAQLAAARDLARALKLPTFEAHGSVVEKRVDEIVALFSLKPKSKQPAGKGQKLSRPIFKPFVDTVPKVIAMAESYLLADLTFRESWEVQRRGVFGVPEMVGKAFPMGLIAEILARHGHDMARPIDTVLQTLNANGFRYYDHDHLPPDADDVGLALRLAAYADQPEKHRQSLQAAVRLLEANISEAGEIPVWLATKAKAEYAVALWGNSCAAVAANVLLGLLSFDPAGHRALIERGGRKLFEAVGEQGVGAGRHYVPLYTIWIVFELISQLQAQSGAAALDGLQTAAQTLAERFEIEAQRHRITAQDAALLTLCCLSTGAPSKLRARFDSEWITVLHKSQRYDGSWPGEPLYGTPTRGELAAWYASSSVTTALCYHALRCYLAYHSPGIPFSS